MPVMCMCHNIFSAEMLLLHRDFVQLAVGGPLVGLAFGIATATWLRYMYNSPMAEITLTILATYGTYIVGDELLHVSAVLAVVTLGALRKYLISRPSERLARQPQKAERLC